MLKIVTLIIVHAFIFTSSAAAYPNLGRISKGARELRAAAKQEDPIELIKRLGGNSGHQVGRSVDPNIYIYPLWQAMHERNEKRFLELKKILEEEHGIKIWLIESVGIIPEGIEWYPGVEEDYPLSKIRNPFDPLKADSTHPAFGIELNDAILTIAKKNGIASPERVAEATLHFYDNIWQHALSGYGLITARIINDPKRGKGLEIISIDDGDNLGSEPLYKEVTRGVSRKGNVWGWGLYWVTQYMDDVTIISKRPTESAKKWSKDYPQEEKPVETFLSPSGRYTIAIKWQEKDAVVLEEGVMDENNPDSTRFFDLAVYKPYLKNPKHLIIHPDEFYDQRLFAKQGIERIMQQVGLGKGRNFEIPGSGGWVNRKHVPPSYLHHKEPKIEKEEDLEKAEAFILDAEELILTGGAYESCHLTWYIKVLTTRIQKGKRIILHFPLDAIYPSTENASSLVIKSSKYVRALELPYSSGILDLKKAIDIARSAGIDKLNFDDVIPSCIFYDGDVIWKNSVHPQVIIHYWKSHKSLFSLDDGSISAQASPEGSLSTMFSRAGREYKRVEQLSEGLKIKPKTAVYYLMLLEQAGLLESEVEALTVKFRIHGELSDSNLALARAYLNDIFNKGNPKNEGNIRKYCYGGGRNRLADTLRENFVETKETTAKEAKSTYDKDAQLTSQIISEIMKLGEDPSLKNRPRSYTVTVNNRQIPPEQYQALEDQVNHITEVTGIEIAVKGTDEPKAPSYLFECKNQNNQIIGKVEINLHSHQLSLDRTLAILTIGLAASSVPEGLTDRGDYAELIKYINDEYKLLDLLGENLIKENATAREIIKILNRHPINIILPPVEKQDFKKKQEFELQQKSIEEFV